MRPCRLIRPQILATHPIAVTLGSRSTKPAIRPRFASAWFRRLDPEATVPRSCRLRPSCPGGSSSLREATRRSVPAPRARSASAIVLLVRHLGAVTIARSIAAERSGNCGSGRLSSTRRPERKAGRPKRRPKCLVSHRGPRGTGMIVGRRIVWHHIPGEGRRESPWSSVKPRPRASWRRTVPASVSQLSGPSTPTSLAPNWLFCALDTVRSGSSNTAWSSVG